ncbi:MAG TPA: hypothetical protein V6D23_01190 [Candidatus Obscuribacterales bacterium]
MTSGLMVLGGFPAAAHEDDAPFQLSRIDKQRDISTVIPSRSVELTESEQQAGIVNLEEVLPVLSRINQRFNIFSATQFNYYVRNFHYPYRDRYELSKQQPPTQVVLHWTANPRTDIPLHTLSAFLRSRRNGQLVERANRYKNVSNYFLTGSLDNLDGTRNAHLVKLTRGDLRSWGDIPRVTAYPTDDNWDDNKYDGRGAVGIEIESPNFSVFYHNASQREKLHNFLLLTLKERDMLDKFSEFRYSPYWEDMVTMHDYLKNNLAKIDVDKRGGIPQNYQYLDKILGYFPKLNKVGVYQEAKKMFQFMSGHGIVSREYNERMVKAKRYRDATYDKIDFTEPHVFVVAMDLLRSDMEYHGIDNVMPFDYASRNPLSLMPALPQPVARIPAKPVYHRLPDGRNERIDGE